MRGSVVGSNSLPQVVKDSRYIDLISQPGSTPHDLFDDFIESAGDRYNQEWAMCPITLNMSDSFCAVHTHTVIYMDIVHSIII